MNKTKSHLYIWDYPDKTQIKIPFGKLILWRSISNDKNIISIPSLIEKWSDSLKNEYLDWIYKLGNFKIRNKKIINYLRIRSNFSAWWFSLIFEKSNFSKSKYIDDIIRILAFKKWIKNYDFSIITLYSSNKKLSEIIRNYCLKKNIAYRFINLGQFSKINFNPKKIFFLLPFYMRGFFWLIYKSLYSLPLIIFSKRNKKKDKNEFIFISYLFNMINSDIDNFQNSSYWGNLPLKLNNDKKYSTWIHIYVKDKYLNNPYKASKIIEKLNLNNKYQTHLTLFSFLNIKIIFKVLLDWFKIYKRLKLINISKNFPLYKDFNFWPLYKYDWLDSFIGNNCIDNLLSLSLFEEALKGYKENNYLIYLLENQGWELSLLSVCRKFNIRKTIGFSHATSRYWDLRNFYDLREFSFRGDLSLPIPNILAVNSNYVLKEFLRFGYPKEKIKLVEALRHLYLNKNIILKQRFNNKKLLVLGDYEDKNTNYQLSILENLPIEILNDLKIIFKPHPASKLNSNFYPALKMEISYKPLSELLPLVNIVYCGSVTSASVDAFSYGLKVIVLVDQKILNLSPLRNFEEVSFIIDSIQLKNVILNFFSKSIYYASPRVIFELSEELPLWKKLLYKKS